MIDFQTIGVLITGVSVTVAAIYYMFTLRINQRNMKATLETRRLQFITQFTEKLNNEEGEKKMVELLNMKWTDWDDFEKKYGSDNNLHNVAIRNEIGRYYDVLGYLLREKLVDAETIYSFTATNAILLWTKQKGLVEYQMKQYFGEDHLRDYEFLAQEMMKIKLKRDPSYRVPESLISYVTNK